MSLHASPESLDVKLTPQQAKTMWLAGDLVASGYLFRLVESLQVEGWWFRIANVTAFCKEWEIETRTFYRAKATLIESGRLQEHSNEVFLRIPQKDSGVDPSGEGCDRSVADCDRSVTPECDISVTPVIDLSQICDRSVAPECDTYVTPECDRSVTDCDRSITDLRQIDHTFSDPQTVKFLESALERAIPGFDPKKSLDIRSLVVLVSYLFKINNLNNINNSLADFAIFEDKNRRVSDFVRPENLTSPEQSGQPIATSTSQVEVDPVSVLHPTAGDGTNVPPTRNKSSKKKTPRPKTAFKYYECLKDDGAKQGFARLYTAHPKSTYPTEAAREYQRQLDLGISPELIWEEHETWLKDWSATRSQEDRNYAPKLHKWLEERYVNRELGIPVLGQDDPLPFEAEYQEFELEYRNACATLNESLGSTKQSRNNWRTLFGDRPERLADFIQAYQFYLGTRLSGKGLICRIEKFIEERWEVVYSHLQIKARVQVGEISKQESSSFNAWVKLAQELRIINYSYVSSHMIPSLQPGSIAVQKFGSEDWLDWHTVAEEYPLSTLQAMHDEIFSAKSA